MNWKTNLTILWFGQFMVMSGMTMIIPFLPYYIQELGVHNLDHVNVWSGIIFSSTFITGFIFQPFWGKLADKYGRKLMILRSGFGMALVIILMGFATTPWHLLLLRILNGTISGFVPAAVSLVSANTPKERIGFAMGFLQSGQVAGTILGPIIGGLLAGWVGFRPIFYVTGTLVLLATLLVLFLVKENFNKQKAQNQADISVVKGFMQLQKIPQLLALFAVTFMIQFGLISSMPLLPTFIQSMKPDSQHLPLYAALISSAAGISNMIAAPILGRLGDRIGTQRILLISLIGSTLIFIPQAFVHHVWQLAILRFVQGLFVGGLIPSVNALIRTYTPEGMEGRSYSFNSSFMALGNMMGPSSSGVMSLWIGIRGIFIVSSFMFAATAIWVYRSLGRKEKHKSA